VFPQTEIQNCIIHQLRNSSKYVSYKDLKALMADLKAVYAAVLLPAAILVSPFRAMFEKLNVTLPEAASAVVPNARTSSVDTTPAKNDARFFI